MTSLDPSHIPSLSGNPRHGGAVHDSVSALHARPSSHDAGSSTSHDDNLPGDDDDTKFTPPWRGAWARRQEARAAKREEEETTTRQEKPHKLPMPPIPDLRFEQGVLMSIRPFLHRVVVPESENATSSATSAKEERHEEKVDAGEKGALVSEALTAEGAKEGLEKGATSDIFSGPLRIEWAQVCWIIGRDQFLYPLLQGLVWGAAGLWLSSLWNWNKARIAAARVNSSSVSRSGGPSLLTQLGIRTR